MGKALAWGAAVAVATPFAVGFAVTSHSEEGTVVFTFTDPAVIESSGLVALDDVVVTTNDSGDVGRVFSVDPATGDTVGVTHWAVDPEDVEALAPGDGDTVWVGDIGDNNAARDDVTVFEVPVGAGDRDVSPQQYRLRYPGGARDAETLLRVPGTGELVIVSKGVFGGEVYVAPPTLDPDGVSTLRREGVALAMATDGAFFPDGRHLIVRNYTSAAVYTWPQLREVATFYLPEQDQGEGLAITPEGQVWVSTEGQYTDVLQVRLPRSVREEVAPPAPTSTPSPSGGAASTEPAEPTTSARRGPIGTGSWWPVGAAGVVVLATGVWAWRRSRKP